MIVSEPILAEEDFYIRVALIEDDYRIRVTDVLGNILFELENENINKFAKNLQGMLTAIQELKVLDKKKEDITNQIIAGTYAFNKQEKVTGTKFSQDQKQIANNEGEMDGWKCY